MIKLFSAEIFTVNGVTMTFNDSPQKFLTEIMPAAVKKARENKMTAIFGSGWRVLTFENNMPTRQDLDKICDDIPIYIADEEGHKGLANTICLVNAGIMSADGKVLKKDTDIRGGEIVFDKNGTPSGYLKEQAGTSTRSFLDNDNLLSVDLAKEIMKKIENQLLSEGYTMYVDGWGNYFYNENYFKAAHEMDKSGKMNFILGLTYELESWMDIDKNIEKAVEVQKYSSERVKTNWVKIFIDGTVETGTGFIDGNYPDCHQGIANWTEKEVTEITRKANEKKFVDACSHDGQQGSQSSCKFFCKRRKKELRNTLIHVRNVNAEDYKKMAENNIFVAAGILWHHNADFAQDALKKILPEEIALKGYPIKSFFDNGINISSHTDFPALSGSPDDPFGIIEIAVTGVYHEENAKAWWT